MPPQERLKGDCPSCGHAYEISREANQEMQRQVDEKCANCGASIAVVAERGGPLEQPDRGTRQRE